MDKNSQKKWQKSEAEVVRREEQRRQELLSRDDIERDYKGVTRRWLELAALSGDGPPMVKLSEAFGPLVVGEGIESVLSAISALPDVGSAWAALSTSGLMSVNLPKIPGELIVAVDGDEAGRKAGQSLAMRATAAGWKVSIADPGDGLDFNDLVSA